MRRLPLVLTVSFALSVAIALVAATPAGAAWVWPVHGDVITPYRNGTDPYATGQHRGIDIAGSVGTPVVAAAGGEIRFAGTAGSSGLTISLRTGDGYDTSYLHLSSLAVRAGAHVSPGDHIGAVGTTGTRSAAAPHLHFGVRDADTRHAYHDPLAFLPAPPAAPEPTPPTPVPAPAPEPASPAPVPVPAPAGAISPRDRPAPRPSTTPRPTPAPRPSPATRATPSPHAHAPLSPAPLETAAIETGRSSRPGLASEQVPASHEAAAGGMPALNAKSDPSPSLNTAGLAVEERAAPQPSTRRSAEAPSASANPSGPDIGWVLACGGLLLAAAILGLTGDSRRAARRSTRIAQVLRPLAGRR